MIERPVARSFVILGQTKGGKAFRPSDWADRICGVLAQYRPPGARSQQAHLSYSPYVMPGFRGEVRCVNVDGRLNQLEPMAYKFLVSFANDNDLTVEGLEGQDAGVADSATPS